MMQWAMPSERPGHHGPRRLVHWINPAGERKVHSLVDKVYKRKNLEVAWEKVKRNRGAGGVDGEHLAAFEASFDANLDRLHRELRDGKYVPQPVLQRLIPKAGQPGKFRPLGIPTIYDRVVRQFDFSTASAVARRENRSRRSFADWHAAFV